VRPTILFADDEPQLLALARDSLEGTGLDVICAEDGARALELFSSSHPHVVVVDLKMPRVDGVSVLRQVKKSSPETPVIVITGHGDVPVAVETMRLGAFDFISKPFHMAQLVATIKRAAERTALAEQVEQLKRDTRQRFSLEERMGRSRAIQVLMSEIAQVARSNFSVLIEGETGAGKDLVARAIHQQSRRCSAPIVAIDCGAIPDTLIESELFGYEKGAFTGADRAKAGSFAAADGGTIFLDEIGNLPPGTQGKLLRILQERIVQPLGSTRTYRIDVRVVAATNVSLEKEVRAGRFRQDLFYRLNEFSLTVPALRDRREDINHLARRFLEEARGELGSAARSFADDALRALNTYDWPGNVRELRNVIRRAALVGPNVIEALHLRLQDRESPMATVPTPPRTRAELFPRCASR
jgi:DNA-binding NtrC family response regulator